MHTYIHCVVIKENTYRMLSLDSKVDQFLVYLISKRRVSCTNDKVPEEIMDPYK